jgi:hypothetical protein
MAGTRARSGRDDGVTIAGSSEGWTIRHEREWGELFASVKDAAWFSPLDWPRAVLGGLSSVMPARYSEYELVWSGKVERLGRYLGDILVPSVPGKAPSWLRPPLSSLFFHRSCELAREGRDPAGRFNGEQWFFINGILTNQDVARMNAAYLVHLFHRPIRVLWNSTDGAGIDLLECASEKLGATGEDVDSAFHPLLDAVADPRKKRVVLICHSQGTLITAVLLRLIRGVYLRTAAGARGQLSRSDREIIRRRAAAEGLTVDPKRLEPVGRDELATLEVYCFANCATDMNYIDAGLSIPRIESFGNEHDLVARLGMLAPQGKRRHVKIAGPRYRNDGAWGHLLNAHYLRDIDKAQRRRSRAADATVDATPYVLIEGSAPAGTVPQLFRYLDGAGAVS